MKDNKQFNSDANQHYPEKWRGEAKIVYLKKFSPISFNDLKNSAITDRDRYFLRVAKSIVKHKYNKPFIAYSDAYGTYRSYAYDKVMWTSERFLISADDNFVYISYAKLEPLYQSPPKPEPNKALALKVAIAKAKIAIALAVE